MVGAMEVPAFSTLKRMPPISCSMEEGLDSRFNKVTVMRLLAVSKSNWALTLTSTPPTVCGPLAKTMVEERAGAERIAPRSTARCKVRKGIDMQLHIGRERAIFT